MRGGGGGEGGGGLVANKPKLYNLVGRVVPGFLLGERIIEGVYIKGEGVKIKEEASRKSTGL